MSDEKPTLAPVYYPKSTGYRIDPPKRASTPDQKRALGLAVAGLELSERELAEALVIYLAARRPAIVREKGELIGYIIDDEVLDLAAGE